MIKAASGEVEIGASRVGWIAGLGEGDDAEAGDFAGELGCFAGIASDESEGGGVDASSSRDYDGRLPRRGEGSWQRCSDFSIGSRAIIQKSL